MRINGRAKGAAGEREFCKWLESNFDYVETAERNLLQVREGGTDVMTNGFYFEVKRVEILSLDKWWSQVLKSVRGRKKLDGEKHKPIPIVAFRQNRKQWSFLISANNIGSFAGYVLINEQLFIKWAAHKFVAPLSVKNS